jgi:hypothetical protein
MIELAHDLDLFQDIRALSKRKLVSDPFAKVVSDEMERRNMDGIKGRRKN